MRIAIRFVAPVAAWIGALLALHCGGDTDAPAPDGTTATTASTTSGAAGAGGLALGVDGGGGAGGKHCADSVCWLLGEDPPTPCPTCACSPAIVACHADAECDALSTCANLCADAPCVQACIAAHPEGRPKYAAIADCACVACVTACADWCTAYRAVGAGGAG